MVIKNKKELIEKLTGIHSSKKSYYVAVSYTHLDVYKRQEPKSPSP